MMLSDCYRGCRRVGILDFTSGGWLLCLLVATTLLAGCSGDPDRQRLVGQWQILVADGLSDQVNAGLIDSSLAEAESAEVGNQSPKMQIQFYWSGYLLTQTNMGAVQSEKRGRWEFLKYDAATNTAQIECTLQGETTLFEVVVEDADTIRLVPPNMAGLRKKMKFVRQ